MFKRVSRSIHHHHRINASFKSLLSSRHAFPTIGAANVLISRTVSSSSKQPQLTNVLSPLTIEIIKSTVPALASHGLAITTSMYARMLSQHPEVAELFNPTHQLVLPGATHASQPYTLACAVHAYAANIDNLGALATAVERIAEKHVSLAVLPQHYPIVGENLLWALRDVLQEAATPEILQAWKEAYFFLADLLIQQEATLRTTKATSQGGE